ATGTGVAIYVKQGNDLAIMRERFEKEQDEFSQYRNNMTEADRRHVCMEKSNRIQNMLRATFPEQNGLTYSETIGNLTINGAYDIQLRKCTVDGKSMIGEGVARIAQMRHSGELYETTPLGKFIENGTVLVKAKQEDKHRKVLFKSKGEYIPVHNCIRK
ncbi:hypothetical protein PENTCL1PPCAC_4581, partial [Pristionchus entomophagus]